MLSDVLHQFDVRPYPRSIKQLLRDAKVPLGGAIREELARTIDDALFSLWERCCEHDGGDFAAVALWFVVSRDPSFPVPWWLKCRFRAHRVAILEFRRYHGGA